MPDNIRPQRKRPAHQPVYETGNLSPIIYVTVCTHRKKKLLARNVIHQHLLSWWTKASHWVVGRYVIMPDHIHFFCSPGIHEHPSVLDWCEFWKSRTATFWPFLEDGKVWQRDAWDTQLRRGQSYGEKWAYVRRNPVRAGLASHENDWPYQGELNVLRWHDA